MGYLKYCVSLRQRRAFARHLPERVPFRGLKSASFPIREFKKLEALRLLLLG
jgi:hypothetical protein